MSGMIRISPTFLDAVRRYLDADAEWKDKARGELLDRLRGIQTTSEAMQRGADFEATLCRWCDGKDVMGDLPESIAGELKTDAAREVFRETLAEMSRYVARAIRQVHVSFQLTPSVRLHGYIDFLDGNTIYDVKTTKKYTEDEFPKYMDHYQHRAYLAALHETGVRHFKYLITDFKGAYAEHYVWDPRYIGELKGAVDEWFEYLKIDDEMCTAWDAKQAREGGR